jgi:hypothetical protein
LALQNKHDDDEEELKLPIATLGKKTKKKNDKFYSSHLYPFKTKIKMTKSSIFPTIDLQLKKQKGSKLYIGHPNPTRHDNEELELPLVTFKNNNKST